MISSTAKLAADAGKITFQAAAAVAPQKLETPGEFLKGGAAFSFPAALVGNDPFSECVLVVVAIQKAIDICVVSLGIKPFGVVAHLLEIDGCATHEMTECQLDVAVSSACFEETTAIQITFGDPAHEFPNADLTKLELRFSNQLTLALHHIGVAKHLLINSANNLLLLGVVIAWEKF